MINVPTLLSKMFGQYTLVGRISTIFFLLAILLAGLQYVVLSSLWRFADAEARQRLEWHLAEDLAVKIQEILNSDSAEVFERVKYRLSEFETINPRISLAVVDATGALVPEFHRRAYYSIEQYKRVPTSVLALAQSVDRTVAGADLVNRSFPVYGPSLETSSVDRVIFSIGSLRFKDRPLFLYAELDSGSYRAIINGLEATYLFFGGILTSVALFIGLAFVGYFSIHRLAKRFRVFTEGVKEIAEGGYSARVPISGNDEVATLGQQINNMAEKIQTSIARLEENDRWRKQMTASLSHDLRTPLAAMLAHNQQLVRKLNAEKNYETLSRLEVFERNLNTMHHYIDGILELSLLESSQFSVEIVPFHIVEIVEDELIPRLQPLADACGISLRSEVSPDAKLVYFDITLFQRILENLVGNALKYSQGTVVCIRFRTEGEFGWLEVIDDGCGMPPESIEELRKPFTRGDAARTSSNPGSGLGLAIVSLIVQAHGSTLEIDSRPEEGTTVRFRLGRTIDAASSMLGSRTANPKSL